MARVFFWYVIVTVNIIPFESGMLLMWASPIIPKFKSVEVEINPLNRVVSTREISVFAAAGILGGMIGTPMFLLISKRVGIRVILFIGNILCLVALLLPIFSNHISLYYLARVIGGTTIGIGLLIVPKYLAEITDTHIRGSVNTTVGVTFALGTVMSSSIGPFTSIMIYDFLLCIAPLMYFGSCYFIPESPYILLAQGKEAAAAQIIKKLKIRNASQHTAELKAIIRSYEGVPIKVLLKNRYNLKVIGIVMIVELLVPLSGSDVLVVYTPAILAETVSILPAKICAIIINVISFSVSLITPLIIEKVGRKPLIMSSSGLMCIATIILGLHFYNHSIYGAAWVPLTFLILYNIAHTMGMTSVLFLIIVEIIPNGIKNVCLAILQVVQMGVAMTFVYITPFINEHFSPAITFWIISVSLVIFTIHVYIFIPESRGKSPDELERLFENMYMGLQLTKHFDRKILEHDPSESRISKNNIAIKEQSHSQTSLNVSEVSEVESIDILPLPALRPPPSIINTLSTINAVEPHGSPLKAIRNNRQNNKESLYSKWWWWLVW